MIRDVQFKLKLGYSNIVGNSGHFRRQALTKLYSNFCDHSVLFCASFYMLSNKGDVKRVKTDCYRYLNFLLYLPRSFWNRRLISKHQATDIVLSVEKLSSNLIDEVPVCLGPNNHLICSFAKLLKKISCIYVIFFLFSCVICFCVFCILCVICSSLFFLLVLHFFPFVSG